MRSMARIFAIYTYIYNYMFQAVRRAVNVLNVSTASKYSPNVIFRSAIINAQRANLTGSMIWLTNQRLPM